MTIFKADAAYDDVHVCDTIRVRFTDGGEHEAAVTYVQDAYNPRCLLTVGGVTVWEDLIDTIDILTRKTAAQK